MKWGKGKKGKVFIQARLLIRPELIPVPSIKLTGTHLYNWVERGTVRVKCLGLEPGPFDLGTGALTMRPLGLTIGWIGVKKNSQFQRFQTRVYSKLRFIYKAVSPVDIFSLWTAFSSATSMKTELLGTTPDPLQRWKQRSFWRLYL